MHHKRGKAKNQRAGCLLCKPHKANGCAVCGMQERKACTVAEGVEDILSPDDAFLETLWAEVSRYDDDEFDGAYDVWCANRAVPSPRTPLMKRHAA